MGVLLLESARKLASIGATFAICPDNTVHQALPYVEPQSPIPWLHIAEVVAEEAQRMGARRLAVLGTRYLMEGPVYAEKLAAVGLEWRTPGEADRATINRIIFEELVFSRVTEIRRDCSILRFSAGLGNFPAAKGLLPSWNQAPAHHLRL